MHVATTILASMTGTYYCPLPPHAICHPQKYPSLVISSFSCMISPNLKEKKLGSVNSILWAPSVKRLKTIKSSEMLEQFLDKVPLKINLKM